MSTWFPIAWTTFFHTNRASARSPMVLGKRKGISLDGITIIILLTFLPDKLKFQIPKFCSVREFCWKYLFSLSFRRVLSNLKQNSRILLQREKHDSNPNLHSTVYTVHVKAQIAAAHLIPFRHHYHTSHCSGLPHLFVCLLLADHV
jgi:hypothetical protein